MLNSAVLKRVTNNVKIRQGLLVLHTAVLKRVTNTVKIKTRSADVTYCCVKTSHQYC